MMKGLGFPNKMKKLNVGCGNVPLIGYFNIDKYYYPGSTAPLNDNALAETWNNNHPESPWMYGDAVNLNILLNDEFDEVMMVHCLEHLSMEDGNLAIKELHRVCKPGGFVEIEVPDLLKACQLMQEVHVTPTGDNQPWHRVMGLLYGTTGMDGEGQFHLCGYSKEYLRFKLEERGFKNIEEIPVGFGHGNSDEGHPEPEYDFRMRAEK